MVVVMVVVEGRIPARGLHNHKQQQNPTEAKTTETTPNKSNPERKRKDICCSLIKCRNFPPLPFTCLTIARKFQVMPNQSNPERKRKDICSSLIKCRNFPPLPFTCLTIARKFQVMPDFHGFFFPSIQTPHRNFQKTSTTSLYGKHREKHSSLYCCL